MKKPLIIFMLIICISAYAGPENFKKSDLQIMDYLYNADLQSADSLITTQMNLEPDNPKYYLLKTQYHFYSRYFTAGLPRDSIIQLVINASQKTISLAENMEESTLQKFYLGSAYGFLSRGYAMQGEFWDAYWAARDCRSYLKEVIENDPSFADAYLGLGVIEYFTGLQYTGFYNVLVWFVGMSGDRETGIEYFTKTAQDGELFKNEANFILSALYSNQFLENDPKAALSVIEPFRMKFPNNPFVERNYHNARFIDLINENGVQFLETEFDSLQTKYMVTNPGLLNLLGYNLMNAGNNDDALVVFKTNVKLFPDIANGYDSLAECYMNRGENDLSIKNYKIAYEKLESDSTINDQFREILREGILDRLEELGATIGQQT